MKSKTDKVDARVIARFAHDVKPRPQAEEQARQSQLEELVARRRQLLELRTAESNRKGITLTKPVQQSLQRSINNANKDLKKIEQAIVELIESHDDWQAG